MRTALGKEAERQGFFRVAHRAEAAPASAGSDPGDGKEGFLEETFNWVQPDTSLALASSPRCGLTKCALLCCMIPAEQQAKHLSCTRDSCALSHRLL